MSILDFRDLLFEQAATSWPFVLVVAIFGFIIGSFLNAQAFRWGKKGYKKGFEARSECPDCKHVLRPFELIPLLSFIIQDGKCKWCKKKISWRYPLVEILTALVFVSIVAVYGLSLQSMALIAIAAVLITVSLVDLEQQILPDMLVLPTLVAVIIFLLLTGNSNIVTCNLSPVTCLFTSYDNWLYGLAIGGGLLGALVLLTKGKGMGIGDIKLGALIGATLGGKATLVALFFSFLVGSIVGLILMGLGRATRKTALPFGPFLAIGWLIAVLWHKQILSLFYF